MAGDGGGQALTDVQRAVLAEALAAERAAAMRQIEALAADFAGIVDAAALAAADDEHDPEGATIAFERAQVAGLLSDARQRLADIDAAMRRLAAGGYGICERCGQPIPPARLAARPMARTCVGCAAQAG